MNAIFIAEGCYNDGEQGKLVFYDPTYELPHQMGNWRCFLVIN